MSDEYTPNLSDGQIYYVAGRTHLRRQITGEQAIDVTPYSHEFDRMIAEVERAAAEKALTDAANELALLDDGGKRGLAGNSKSSASAITHRHAVAVIRARAEAYRQERGE